MSPTPLPHLSLTPKRSQNLLQQIYKYIDIYIVSLDVARYEGSGVYTRQFKVALAVMFLSCSLSLSLSLSF